MAHPEDASDGFVPEDLPDIALHRLPSLDSLPEAARMAEVRTRLQQKLPRRPSREDLRAQNILKSNYVAPGVQARQEALAKAHLSELLKEHIAHRPGPLDLVRSQVLKLPEPLKSLLETESEDSEPIRDLLRSEPPEIGDIQTVRQKVTHSSTSVPRAPPLPNAVVSNYAQASVVQTNAAPIHSGWGTRVVPTLRYPANASTTSQQPAHALQQPGHPSQQVDSHLSSPLQQQQESPSSASVANPPSSSFVDSLDVLSQDGGFLDGGSLPDFDDLSPEAMDDLLSLLQYPSGVPTDGTVSSPAGSSVATSWDPLPEHIQSYYEAMTSRLEPAGTQLAAQQQQAPFVQQAQQEVDPTNIAQELLSRSYASQQEFPSHDATAGQQLPMQLIAESQQPIKDTQPQFSPHLHQAMSTETSAHAVKASPPHQRIINDRIQSCVIEQTRKELHDELNAFHQSAGGFQERVAESLRLKRAQRAKILETIQAQALHREQLNAQFAQIRNSSLFEQFDECRTPTSEVIDMAAVHESPMSQGSARREYATGGYRPTSTEAQLDMQSQKIFDYIKTQRRQRVTRTPNATSMDTSSTTGRSSSSARRSEPKMKQYRYHEYKFPPGNRKRPGSADKPVVSLVNLDAPSNASVRSSSQYHINLQQQQLLLQLEQDILQGKAMKQQQPVRQQPQRAPPNFINIRPHPGQQQQQQQPQQQYQQDPRGSVLPSGGRQPSRSSSPSSGRLRTASQPQTQFQRPSQQRLSKSANTAQFQTQSTQGHDLMMDPSSSFAAPQHDPRVISTFQQGFVTQQKNMAHYQPVQASTSAGELGQLEAQLLEEQRQLQAQSHASVGGGQYPQPSHVSASPSNPFELGAPQRSQSFSTKPAKVQFSSQQYQQAHLPQQPVMLAQTTKSRSLQLLQVAQQQQQQQQQQPQQHQHQQQLQKQQLTREQQAAYQDEYEVVISRSRSQSHSMIPMKRKSTHQVEPSSVPAAMQTQEYAEHQAFSVRQTNLSPSAVKSAHSRARSWGGQRDALLNLVPNSYSVPREGRNAPSPSPLGRSSSSRGRTPQEFAQLPQAFPATGGYVYDTEPAVVTQPSTSSGFDNSLPQASYQAANSSAYNPLFLADQQMSTGRIEVANQMSTGMQQHQPFSDSMRSEYIANEQQHELCAPSTSHSSESQSYGQYNLALSTQNGRLQLEHVQQPEESCDPLQGSQQTVREEETVLDQSLARPEDSTSMQVMETEQSQVMDSITFHQQHYNFLGENFDPALYLGANPSQPLSTNGHEHFVVEPSPQSSNSSVLTPSSPSFAHHVFESDLGTMVESFHDDRVNSELLGLMEFPDMYALKQNDGMQTSSDMMLASSPFNFQ